MQKRPNNGTPKLFREKPPRQQPSTRVHTAETTINGKTYETTTIETPYGSTTTKEKKPKTAQQWEREQKFMDVAMWIFLVVLVILLAVGFLRKNGILYLW